MRVVRARVGKALIKHLQLPNLFDIPNDIMVWLLTGQYFLVVVVFFFSQFVSFEHKFIWRTRNRAEEIHGQATC